MKTSRQFVSAACADIKLRAESPTCNVDTSKIADRVRPIKESVELISAVLQVFSKLATDEDPEDLTPVAPMVIVVMALAVSQDS